MLNEDFDVDESLAYEYVRATIDTEQEQLLIYYWVKKAGLIEIYECNIGENVKEFEEKFWIKKVCAMLWTLPDNLLHKRHRRG